MKILQVVRQYYPSTGGMEDYVANLCRQLRQRGHVSDVATLDYLFKTDTRLPPYEHHDGTDIIRLPSRGNARYFFAPRLLDALPRYDLVHIHGVDFFVDLLGSFKQAHGKPVVLTTHGGFFHTSWFPAFKNAYFRSLTRHSLKGIDRVIASSPKDKELFDRISDRVTLVENGIDYETFAAVEKDTVPGRMIFIGRLSRNKRVDRLLRMLAFVREARPEAHLVIVGPDWEGLQPGLETVAAELGVTGAVSFRGSLPRDEMLAELARAQLFVSASQYEAFGLSTVEAMASGTVPAVSHIQAFSDIISDGQTGFLVDFNSVTDAAALIGTIIALPGERLAAIGAAAHRAANKYDWRSVADEILSVYDGVVTDGVVSAI
jgi:alpha-1,3-mannosyltransferase